jgi:hypothetical protein
MLIEDFVGCGFPQFGGSSSGMNAGVDGVLFVTVMMRLSPGFKCKVGSSKPSGVMKHRSSVPSLSNLCSYENRTVRTPLELKSAGGLWATRPALKRRGQGFATGGTGVGGLVEVVVCAAARECESMSALLEGVSLNEFRPINFSVLESTRSFTKIRA